MKETQSVCDGCANVRSHLGKETAVDCSVGIDGYFSCNGFRGKQRC